MRFGIDREHLLQGLARVQGIVERERRGTLPILANVLLRVHGDEITIAATDLEVGIRSTYPARVRSEGAVTLAGKMLFEIIREVEDNEISIHEDGQARVVIESGAAQFSLLSISSEEYPTIPSDEDASLVEMEAGLLGEMIDRTLFATSTDESRYNLNGVYMEQGKKGQIRCVATDGHRLSLIQRSVSSPLPFLKKGIIVPRKGLGEIRKLCEDADGSIELGLHNGFLIVRRPGLLLSCRLIDGEFPNYQQVLPTEFRTRVVIERERLVHALRRMALLAKDRAHGFRMTLEDGVLGLSASNPDLGEAHEELSVDYSGERFTSGFNARYLLDALGAIPSKEIVLELIDELAPAQIRPADDVDHLTVVMPMRM